ncbi:MAG: hypothetical protein ACYDDZ_15330 [Acidimicrobiales bacterium]
MKTKILAYVALVLACIGVACSQPSGAPAPTPTSSAVVAHPAIPSVPSLPADVDDPKPPSASRPPLVPKVDTRTPGQIADAACRGAGGIWYCGARKAPLMAGNASSGQCGPACTVPAWFLDFADISGCASDSNSGTSATCTGAGIGPLLHVSQLYSRWGTRSPMLNSPTNATVITVMSSQPSASADPWGEFSPTEINGLFELVGTPAAVGPTFLAGAVTAITRANPGNDFQVNIAASTGAASGQLLYDSTVAGGSYCWVVSIAANVATCTHPLRATDLTTPSNALPAPTDNAASWALGDTLQLFTVPTIYANSIAPTVGTQASSGTSSGLTWIQSINLGDSSGSSGNSTVMLRPTDYAGISLVRADAIVEFRAYDTNWDQGNNDALYQIDWLSGADIAGYTYVYGGDIGGTALRSMGFDQGFILLKDDVILGSSVLQFPGTTISAYNVHTPNAAGAWSVEPESAIFLRTGTGASIWGAMPMTVFQGAEVANRAASFTANLIVGTLKLTSAGLTTGSIPPTPVSTFTMNGTSEVAVPAVAGAFPINAPIWWSLNTVGTTPCAGGPPYFDRAQAAGQFFVKSLTAGCNDVYNWQAGQVDGITITSANIDTFGAIFDPKSGARFTN